MTNQKKFLFIALIIVLALGVLYGTRTYWQKKLSQQEDQKKEENTTPETQSLYPPGINQAWILEKDAVILSTYSGGGQATTQSTLLYESKLSLKAAADGYAKFLKDSGWAVTTKSIGTTLVSIQGTRGAEKVMVVVNRNEVSKKVTIDVTLLPPAASLAQ